MRRLAPTMIAIFATACASAEAVPDASADRPDAPRPDASGSDPDADTETPDADPGTPDAPVGTPDAMTTPDAMPPATGPHLLLSEVVLQPSGGEMIEIVNPTTATIDLATYYVTDVPTYYALPAGAQSIASTDFIARFPAGATIAAGATITVSIATAAEFTTAYGAAPTYSVTGGTMIVDAVGTSNLTNAGEPVILFRWDGASDLVKDVDIVNAGNPNGANVLVAKTGLSIDGPDAGSATSTYAADALTIPTKTAPSSGKSQKRILVEGTHETATGGNGITGHDETTEAIDTTWDTAYTNPTPGSPGF
jgi:uncharacterized protein